MYLPFHANLVDSLMWLYNQNLQPLHLSIHFLHLIEQVSFLNTTLSEIKILSSWPMQLHSSVTFTIVMIAVRKTGGCNLNQTTPIHKIFTQNTEICANQLGKVHTSRATEELYG